MINPYLFVYGTLKLGNDNPVATYLHEHSILVCEGSMPGRLFDLGNYPGAHYIECAKEEVKGEIFKIKNPGQVLEVLDEYEGISSELPEPHEYVREICPIKTEVGPILCWVYLYNLTPL